MMKVLGVCAAVIAAASPAVAGRPDEDALDRYNRTGETVNCVNMRSTDITAIDENTLLFRVGPGDYYLNTTRGACNDVDSNFTRIDVTLFGSRLCSGEILKVVDQQSGVFQGACSLGDFEKLTKKPAETAAAE